MKASNIGIGTKIFGGFTALIIIGLVIGGAGYISLSRVIDAGELNEAALEVQTKILQARNYEKNYIIKRDDQSYNNLMQSLDQIGGPHHFSQVQAGTKQ